MPNLKKLKGANMGIDLIPNPDLSWEQDECPWNVAESTKEHRCAVKDVSLCPHFGGVEYPDTLLCSYPEKYKE